ncbi:MAG: class I SAM-dependent methyltransferase [Pseudomonadales bacterium]|nr:class I SAM-dependent methyltransferase [Pseudomonadales bacterium]
MKDVAEKQQRERDFWANSPEESPGANSLSNLLNKMGDAAFFEQCVRRHWRHFEHAATILELGAGQGWASCLLKRLLPTARITTTDISEDALQSLPDWERVFGTCPDAAYACLSYETREEDASVDVVFCFAAAHHFLTHRRTLAEIARILKPGGVAIYFSEPTTPAWLHPIAHWRVNRIRPEVPEDVLITSRLRGLARSAGLGFEVDYHADLTRRSLPARLYYGLLNRLPFLAPCVPCAANLVFTRTGDATAKP